MNCLLISGREILDPSPPKSLLVLSPVSIAVPFSTLSTGAEGMNILSMSRRETLDLSLPKSLLVSSPVSTVLPVSMAAVAVPVKKIRY